MKIKNQSIRSQVFTVKERYRCLAIVLTVSTVGVVVIEFTISIVAIMKGKLHGRFWLP